jgi:hypothetical protein
MDQIEIGVDTLRFEGNVAKLYEELAKAQTEFTPIPRNKPGQSGNRNFKYADYATIMRCVRPALAAHGISVLQPLHSRDGNAVTTTILAGHGGAIISSLSFPAQKDPQEFGKHHTYYRRYQLQSMLGLEGDKDADDLPDVNDEYQGFKEPAKEAEPKPSPKATTASAEKKPAPAKEQKTNGSAKPSVDSTESSETKPAPKLEAIDSIPEDKLNGVLSSIMKQMNPPWKLMNVREFYAEHFDAKPEEMPHPDNMKAPLKREILRKLVEVKGVAPF